MRISICDDDEIFTKQLEKYIRDFFDNKYIKCPEITSFAKGEDLLEDKKEKDLVFLDIEMPGINGIIVGNELARRKHNVIIFVVTSYPEYLDDAMRFHVFRYLSKPLDTQRLYRNMADALNCYNKAAIKIPIETKEKVYTISSSGIIAVEAQNQKVIIHTLQQDFISVHNMAYWFKLLPHNSFFQSHRSFIVNFQHVLDFDHSIIHLSDRKLTAYLTRRKYHAFKDAYFLYLESMK